MKSSNLTSKLALLVAISAAGWMFAPPAAVGVNLTAAEAGRYSGGADCVNAKQKECGGGATGCRYVTIAAEKTDGGSMYVKYTGTQTCGYPHPQPDSCGTYDSCNPCTN